MPVDVGGHTQALVVGDNVYVRGGNSWNTGIVMVYSIQTGAWSTLPPHDTELFGMASVNNQLILVGGRSMTTGEATNVLVVWDEKSQTWTHPFPVMPTARRSPSVMSYQNWLVVAGGVDGRNSRLNKVELLDTLSGQWYEGSPLPTACESMSSAINGNMWYLSGGVLCQRLPNKHIFSVCLDDLISQACSQFATCSLTSTPWQALPESPLHFSTAIILNGALLTVGGSRSSSIHHYQPGSRSWVKVGDLPVRLSQCACAVLPNGEMLVAGGETNTHGSYYVYSKQVRIVCVV